MSFPSRDVAPESAIDAAHPVLTTERFNLVAPMPRHAAGLFDYGSDPRFTAFLDSAPFATEADAGRFLESLRDENSSGKRLYWVAECRSDGVAVGTLGLLFPFSSRHRTAEFGYGFAPSTWGTGAFAEAATAVMHYGFVSLGLHRIQATTRATNTRSIKGVEKLGFRLEAELADFYQEADGGRSDAVILGLLASRAVI